MSRILVIEPVARNRVEVTDVLASAGYDVIAAANASAALKLLQTRTPDLILLELRLPGISGLSLLESLRADPRWDRVPVIVFTDFSDGVSFRQARHSGANKYLVRWQTSPADLLRQIEHQLHPHTHAPPAGDMLTVGSHFALPHYPASHAPAIHTLPDFLESA